MIAQIPPKDLKELMDSDQSNPLLLDVRESWECEICMLSEAINIPMNEIPKRLVELNPVQPVIVICHHGTRSQAVAEHLTKNNFQNVSNLIGGIDAWARQIETDMPTY